MPAEEYGTPGYVPTAFAPVPEEDGLYFALGRNIPSIGNWERTDTLPRNHHERQWWRGPVRDDQQAREMDRLFIVRKAVPLVELRVLRESAGYILADTGRRIAYVKLWPDGTASYHDAADLLLGRAAPHTKLKVIIKRGGDDG